MADAEERLPHDERELRETAGRLELALRDLRRANERIEADSELLQEYRHRARSAERRLGAFRTRPVHLALNVALIVRGLYRRARSFVRAGRKPQGPTQKEFAAAIARVRPDGGPSEGPLVSMIVLTRNGEKHLRRLLAALRDRTAYRSFELIVVDNASEDGTGDLLAQTWPFPIRVIRNEENLSFSAGNNQGVAAAEGDLILFLN